MKTKTALHMLWSGIVNPRLYTHDGDYVLLISHMRSRSTLISHILGSSPEIEGHRELHMGYTRKQNYLELRYKTWNELRWEKPMYLLDKLLHNSFAVNQSLAKVMDVKFIVFARRPEPTINSITAMGKKLNRADYMNVEWAKSYYSGRIQWMMEFMKQATSESYYFFESDSIVNAPVDTLSNITKFLGLSTPLRENYTVFSDTGLVGRGDPSENIKSGEILSDRTLSENAVILDPCYLREQNECFDLLCEMGSELNR